MRVTLVRPRIGRMEGEPGYDRVSMEPLNIGVLAGLTPPDVSLSFFDDRTEEIDFDRPADLAAITVETFTARRAYDIAAAYRRRGVPVVLGGIHPTLHPEEAARYADAVYRGDAERQWAQVLADARQGRLRPRYDGGDGASPAPARPRPDIFTGKRYLPFTLSQFSRGCPNQCTFCASSAYFGHRHRCRPPEDVLAELDARPPRIVFFVDDNPTADLPRVKAFLRALAPRNISWVSQLSVDAARDPELLRLLKESGCLGFVVGFESVNPENLRAMNKPVNAQNFQSFRPEIRALRDHGFQLWAAFTVGHDSDTPASVEDMLDFALAHRFAFAAFNTLTPYPGTSLYRRLREEGRLLYDGAWWLHPAYRYNYAAFRPRHLTADQLTELAFSLRRRFNRVDSLAGRVLSSAVHGGGWLALSLIGRYGLFFRAEMRKKQGLALG